MRSQHLLPGSEASSLTKLASGSVALQAQDVAATALSARARTSGITAESLRRQGARASVCRSWLMRNTIFLFATADLAWMRPLLAERPLAWATRRLGQLGVSEAKRERARKTIAEMVADEPLPRAEAIEAIRALGIGRDDSAPIYWLVHALVLDGTMVVRPALDRVQTFVAAPPPKNLERGRGLGRLARRYLAAFGPATPDDFGYFFKAGKRDAALAFDGAGRTVTVETERGPMQALPASLDPSALGDPVIRLLGIWDHFLLGWRDRTLTMPPTDAAHARQPSGHPTAFANGRAFGVWRTVRRSRGIEVVVEPFEKVPRGSRPGLEAEVADIGRFLETDAALRIA
jgi:hypothetical protein